MRHLLLILPLLLAAACASVPEEASQAAPPSPGRALYERSCQKCHALFRPVSFDAEEWRFYVRKYGARARLGEEQKRLVYEYLAAHARR